MANDADLSIGRRVRELRESARMSQGSLATAMTRLGHPWHQSTVSRIEHGTQPLAASELPGLAGIFSVSPVQLLGLDVRLTAEERRKLEYDLREQIAAEIAGQAREAA